MRNLLTCKGPKEKVSSILRFLCQEGRTSFDFNLILPMPEEYEEIPSDIPWTEVAMGEYLVDCTTVLMDIIDGKTVRETMKGLLFSHPKTDEEILREYIQIYKDRTELGVKSYLCYKKYGHKCGFAWRICQWGPPCNPVWCEDLSKTRLKKITEDVWTFQISFDTVVFTCPHIFQVFSHMFPSVSMILEYADEDLGCNCGTLTNIENKRHWGTNWPEHSKKACEHARKVWRLRNPIYEDANGMWHVQR